ncbi:Uma2 family endonuclease [Streptomyces sp. NPDC090106]|uniref:Uma2 family endonuclease n=1 Tax=Streptomyces sp. NPDC090106 TaxID=3365946 RepID=UPI003804DF54
MTEQSVYRQLCEFRETFDPPELLVRPEISHGQLLMMMSPRKQHQLVAHRLRVQLEPQLDTDLVLMLQTDMEDAALGVLRIPELVVIDEEEATADSDAIDPRRSHLVIEIVSRSNPANDYEGKLRAYPAMGVPHYLIVDPRDGTTGRPPAAAPKPRMTTGSTTCSETRLRLPDGRSTRPSCPAAGRMVVSERHGAVGAVLAEDVAGPAGRTGFPRPRPDQRPAWPLRLPAVDHFVCAACGHPWRCSPHHGRNGGRSLSPRAGRFGSDDSPSSPSQRRAY